MAAKAQTSLEEQIRRMTPVSAPADQHEALEALSQLLRLARARVRSVPTCQVVGPDGETIVALPEAVFYVLKRVADVLARGDAITVVPVGKELTTQQAANLLNVSRQYVVRLLDQGRIPYTKTGKHRRLRVEDVLAFRRKRDQERRTKLDELTRMSEEIGGYTELE